MHENKGVKNNFLNLNLITYIKPNVQIYFSTFLPTYLPSVMYFFVYIYTEHIILEEKKIKSTHSIK